MRQLQQNIRAGDLEVADIPIPTIGPGEVLIANLFSVISAGTEKMTRDLAKKSLLGKARERPGQARRVLKKIRSEGILQTYRQVKTKLDVPMTMGYCSAGVVLACGTEVQEFKPGDRVASNGPHAEVVAVPRHLCARIPDSVAFDQATFTVLGAIALQGARLSKTALGETVFVIGLGMVGLLTVAVLKAAGCRVIGTDPDASRCHLAIEMGADVACPNMSAEDVENLTGDLGADAVIIAASTHSNGPIELAANAVRKKGRIVLVGVVGLQLDRRPFYFKEAEFVVSCSYGPGRYEVDYEQLGHDYPPAYVRWTEQRNMAAVLNLMASGQLDVRPLISHRFPIEEAHKAYDLIDQKTEPFTGILFEYPDANTPEDGRQIELRPPQRNGRLGVGVLGAGSFAQAVLLPQISRQSELSPVSLCSAGGSSANLMGRKIGFSSITTDEDQVFEHPDVGVVFSITRHCDHARHVLKAIRSGKPIFVEKPLCITLEEFNEIDQAISDAASTCPIVMVGFNRRFSPAAKLAAALFAEVDAPRAVSIRFNAGAIPADHWTQIDEIGGGRIVGEACHAIDLATFLAGSPPVRVFAESVGGDHRAKISDDQCFITLRHANGSISNVAYLAGGDSSLPKERVEVFGGGGVAVIDDFRTVTTHRKGKKHIHKLGSQDKGHAAEIEAFTKSVTDGAPAPIPWSDIRAVTLASLLAVRSLREGVPRDVVTPTGS